MAFVKYTSDNESGVSMYDRFGLVLMLTHACNLRCRYCYTGEKFIRIMTESIGRKAIDRAIASMNPGGTLELGFFGGEPLLEAELLAVLVAYAREQIAARRMELHLSMTTNGTLSEGPAWSVMNWPDLSLAVSCDGLPQVHDRHRVRADGSGSSETVLSTIRKLITAGRDFHVVMVVRPDTVEQFPEGILSLQGAGVKHIEPAMDLWAGWSEQDVQNLQQAIARVARIWRDGLPHHSIGWFDEKAAELAHLKKTATARCGFGQGELAVAPSGRLYPCERLIGEDREDNPMRLPGIATDGDDFLCFEAPSPRSEPSCDCCAMVTMCNTFCRCGNYTRTGDIRKPDWLLCAWNQACLEETARVLKESPSAR